MLLLHLRLHLLLLQQQRGRRLQWLLVLRRRLRLLILLLRDGRVGGELRYKNTGNWGAGRLAHAGPRACCGQEDGGDPLREDPLEEGRLESVTRLASAAAAVRVCSGMRQPGEGRGARIAWQVAAHKGGGDSADSQSRYGCNTRAV